MESILDELDYWVWTGTSRMFPPFSTTHSGAHVVNLAGHLYDVYKAPDAIFMRVVYVRLVEESRWVEFDSAIVMGVDEQGLSLIHI